MKRLQVRADDVRVGDEVQFFDRKLACWRGLRVEEVDTAAPPIAALMLWDPRDSGHCRWRMNRSAMLRIHRRTEDA